MEKVGSVSAFDRKEGESALDGGLILEESVSGHQLRKCTDESPPQASLTLVRRQEAKRHTQAAGIW